MTCLCVCCIQIGTVEVVGTAALVVVGSRPQALAGLSAVFMLFVLIWVLAEKVLMSVNKTFLF